MFAPRWAKVVCVEYQPRPQRCWAAPLRKVTAPEMRIWVVLGMFSDCCAKCF